MPGKMGDEPNVGNGWKADVGTSILGGWHGALAARIRPSAINEIAGSEQPHMLHPSGPAMFERTDVEIAEQRIAVGVMILLIALDRGRDPLVIVQDRDDPSCPDHPYPAYARSIVDGEAPMDPAAFPRPLRRRIGGRGTGEEGGEEERHAAIIAGPGRDGKGRREVQPCRWPAPCL